MRQLAPLERLAERNVLRACHKTAAELAQRSYAQAMLSRTKDLEANLGLVEKAWKGITGAAKSAWDAMLNVGRQVNPGDALKAAEDRLTQLQNAASGTGANQFLPGRASRGNQEIGRAHV